MSSYLHDPQAVLDYRVDWSAWLADGESITSHSVSVDGSVTVDSSSVVGGTDVVVWVSGGTAGENATVTAHVVTDQGREDDRSFRLLVRQR